MSTTKLCIHNYLQNNLSLLRHHRTGLAPNRRPPTGGTEVAAPNCPRPKLQCILQNSRTYLVIFSLILFFTHSEIFDIDMAVKSMENIPTIYLQVEKIEYKN